MRLPSPDRTLAMGSKNHPCSGKILVDVDRYVGHRLLFDWAIPLENKLRETSDAVSREIITH